MTWASIDTAPLTGVDILATGTYTAGATTSQGPAVEGQRWYGIVQWNIYWGRAAQWVYTESGGAVNGVVVTHWAALTEPEVEPEPVPAEPE